MPKKPNPPTISAGLRRRAEVHLGNHQPKTAPNRTAAEARQTLHELEIHQIELEMQNAELIIARDELELALVRYADLLDFAVVGYLSIDESGMILEANHTSAALLSAERSRIINRRLPLFVSPTCLPVFLAFLKNVFTRTRGLACEAIILKKGGGMFWADFRATPAISFGRGQKHCQLVFRDITAHKQAAQLSAREMEVLQLVAEGKPNKESAAGLGISPRTVEKHRGHVMEKLNIHDTAGLTRYAISTGIIRSRV